MVFLQPHVVAASIGLVSLLLLIGSAYGGSAPPIQADRHKCSNPEADGKGYCQQEQGKLICLQEPVGQGRKVSGSPSLRGDRILANSNDKERTEKAPQQYFGSANTTDAREHETLVHDSNSQLEKLEEPAYAEELKVASSSPEIRNLLNEIETQMVEIPAGSYLMGCDSVERSCTRDESPVHGVSVRSFCLGKYEVTFDQYDVYAAATGRDKPSDLVWGRGNRPVINVSYEDATAYTDWLTEQTGRTFRLPTEAEWEYAARAGTTTAYSWGNAIGMNMANCDGCGSEWGGKTAPVGRFAPNGFGLFDMHGNVWEWVQDSFHPNYEGAPVDGSVWALADSPRRILRGGAWFETPWFLRVSHRNDWLETKRNASVGFRIAQDL